MVSRRVGRHRGQNLAAQLRGFAQWENLGAAKKLERNNLEATPPNLAAVGAGGLKPVVVLTAVSCVLTRFDAQPDFLQKSLRSLYLCGLNGEPALGFEPRTDGLQNRCSTTELCRRGWEVFTDGPRGQADDF